MDMAASHTVTWPSSQHGSLRVGRLLSRGKQQIFQEERHSCWWPGLRNSRTSQHCILQASKAQRGGVGARGVGGGIPPLGKRSNTAFSAIFHLPERKTVF